MKGRITVLIALILFALWLGPAGRVYAQHCIQLHSVVDDATIYLRSSQVLASGTPSMFCDLDPTHNYVLTIRKPGYETRRVNFGLGLGESRLHFSARRPKHLLYSAILPGLGQMAETEYLRGTGTLLSAAVSGYLFYNAYTDYRDERDNSRSLSARANDAATLAEKEKYLERQYLSSALTNIQRSFMFEVGALGGWIYLGNLVETLLLSAPPKVVSVQANQAVFDMTYKSRTRAVMRSLFSPGMGQKYRGKMFKGFMYYAAAITTAYLAIDARRDYATADIQYQMAVRDLKLAGSMTEINAARADVAVTYEELRDQEKRRNTYYILLGSIWFLNVLDASMSSGYQEPDNLIKFETSYRNREVTAGVRIGF